MDQYVLNSTHCIRSSNFKQLFLPHKSDICHSALDTYRELSKKQVIHSRITMKSAGFEYTNDGDAALCHQCELKISGWTSDMKPFTIHKQRSPTCPFVLSMLPSNQIITSTMNNASLTTSSGIAQEQQFEETGTNTTVGHFLLNKLVEANTLKEVRKRTFSNWPHRSSPSASQMIEAGFFNCNVGDRAICIYCNIICQQWTPNSDDPCEVHKTLSPKCPYVISILTRLQSSSILVINEHSTRDQSSASTNTDLFRGAGIVHTAACNTAYIEIPKRYTSFANWPTENLPSVDDLVKAGFFFTGTKTVVTCFYCNGSLQNWGAKDNPTVEHARWFPHCAYAKQLCGAELYRKIQQSKRAQQDRANSTNLTSRSAVNNCNPIDSRSLVPDETTLARLVAARLDLPISQSLLDRDFKLSVIKRCWEDQLRLKHEDFVSDCDLLMACTILQKQIQYIDGKKENIIVPSMMMKKIQDREQQESRSHDEAVPNISTTNSSNNKDTERTASSLDIIPDSANSKSSDITQKDNRAERQDVDKHQETTTPSLTNPCVLCLQEEKRLACIPCGHLVTCVPCGHSLRTCPICRGNIEAFVRIYI